MPAYLQKAHNNIVTAEVLFNNGLTKSSAHPAYYSAFLSIKYVLAYFCSVAYEQQDIMSHDADSHNRLSSIALPEMIKLDATTGRDYLVWYNKLKKMRRLADYKPDPIADSMLQDNLIAAKNFFNCVKTHFLIAQG